MYLRRQYPFVGVLVFVVIILLLAIFFVRLWSVRSYPTRWFDKTPRLAVVRVEGPIFDAGSVFRQIEDLKKYKRIRGIILRVDSPGGPTGPAEEILEAVRLYREERGVKVYTSMGRVAASGGYWVSLAADRIYANPSTITGSIGVLMEHVNLAELYDWLKIKPTTLKSGKYKDMGSPARDLTPEETALLKGFLADIHAQFKEKIVAHRDISEEVLDSIAEGQIFTGREALRYGLVDELGGYHLAVRDLREALGLHPDEPVYDPTRRHSLMGILQETLASALLSLVAGVEDRLASSLNLWHAERGPK